MKKTKESILIDTTNITDSFKPFHNTISMKPLNEEQQREFLKAVVEDMSREYHKTVFSGSRNWSTMTVSNYIIQLKLALGMEDD